MHQSAGSPDRIKQLKCMHEVISITFTVLATCQTLIASAVCEAVPTSFDFLRDVVSVDCWASLSLDCTELPDSASVVTPRLTAEGSF